eukprot:TRINITY_DN874_c0_g1_i1.p1 TRINITY_DN874_c0_g1~~TRINITY_DN874_c0_g1_i1.p1  ORF type:complete len:127 (-),score=53.15 TRINITY_DN874_c0_g1_i1:79-459(-)
MCIRDRVEETEEVKQIKDGEEEEEEVAKPKSRMGMRERMQLEGRQEALMVVAEQELLEAGEVREMPARDYALKYAMPALHKALCMIGRLRPEDPIDFVSNFLLNYDPDSPDTLEPGKLDLKAFGQN